MSNLPDLIEDVEPDLDTIQEGLYYKYEEWCGVMGIIPSQANFEEWIERVYE